MAIIRKIKFVCLKYVSRSSYGIKYVYRIFAGNQGRLVTFLKEEPLPLTKANERRHLPEGGTTYPKQG